MTIHGLAGLPRSGSTLLANVLVQNPDIFVSGSSPLVEIEAGISRIISQAPDVVAELAGDQLVGDKFAYGRYRSAMAAFAESYYADRSDREQAQVVFDKGRLWSNHAVLMRAIFPESRIVVTVRDPRDIVASIERQNRATGIFTSHTGQDAVRDAASAIMSPNGSVGLFVRGIEDMLLRELPNVTFVRFESFLAQPQGQIDAIYTSLGLAPFKHDFVNVTNAAPDVDAIYRYKFPHDGSGTIDPKRAGSWKGTLHPGLADEIAKTYPHYMQVFGYS